MVPPKLPRVGGFPPKAPLTLGNGESIKLYSREPFQWHCSVYGTLKGLSPEQVQRWCPLPPPHLSPCSCLRGRQGMMCVSRLWKACTDGTGLARAHALEGISQLYQQLCLQAHPSTVDMFSSENIQALMLPLPDTVATVSVTLDHLLFLHVFSLQLTARIVIEVYEVFKCCTSIVSTSKNALYVILSLKWVHLFSTWAGTSMDRMVA